MASARKEILHPSGASSSPAEVDLTADKGRGKDEDAAAPPMPIERDESTSATGGVPSQRVQQGSRDVKRGVRDTSRAEESDRTYDKLKK